MPKHKHKQIHKHKHIQERKIKENGKLFLPLFHRFFQLFNKLSTWFSTRAKFSTKIDSFRIRHTLLEKIWKMLKTWVFHNFLIQRGLFAGLSFFSEGTAGGGDYDYTSFYGKAFFVRKSRRAVSIAGRNWYTENTPPRDPIGDGGRMETAFLLVTKERGKS